MGVWGVRGVSARLKETVIIDLCYGLHAEKQTESER